MGIKDVISRMGRGAVNIVTGRNKPQSYSEKEVREALDEQYAKQSLGNIKRESMQDELKRFKQERELRQLRQQIAQNRPINRFGRVLSRAATGGYSSPGQMIQSGISRRGYGRRFEPIRYNQRAKQQFKGAMGRGGRPPGTVKYYIPGKGAVGVFEYRAWIREQRRINNIRFQQQLAQNPQLARQVILSQMSSQIPLESPQIPQNQINQPQSTNLYKNPIQTTGLNLWASDYSMTGNMMPLNSGGLNLNTPFMNQNQNVKPTKRGEVYTEVDLLTGKTILKKRW